MSDIAGFDPTFDFRTDAGGGDPDSTSPTLRAYHKLLWSKPLPGGDLFDLDDITPPYLRHRSSRGEFYLTSDSASPTWIRWSQVKWPQKLEVIPHIPESVLEQFRTTARQMGGKMLFPGKQIDRKLTINQERGRNSRIADRLDLTLECIRLHYLGETNPLAETLTRYGDFFALFEDFNGYTNFFLLQDLVSADSSTVKFLMPFDDFGTSPLPDSVEAYQDYRRNAIRFVDARNRRMTDYAASR